MQEKPFTVLIAEDDPQQLEQLSTLLRRMRPEWELLPPARTAVQARSILDASAPTLCIFDVELGAVSGIDLVRSAPDGLAVIFVTGHPTYAVDAFDCSAIDFVTKPIRSERLEAALRKAESLLGQRSTGYRDPGVQASLLRFTKGRDLVMAPLAQVVFFQAQHKYTRVVLEGQEGLLRINLSTVIQNLDPKKFWRVHRSYVVNVAQLASSRRDEMGRVALRFAGRDDRLLVSRPYEHLFSRDGFA